VHVLPTNTAEPNAATQSTATLTQHNNTSTHTQLLFDQAELKCIMHKIETNLKSKFEAAIN